MHRKFNLRTAKGQATTDEMHLVRAESHSNASHSADHRFISLSVVALQILRFQEDFVLQNAFFINKLDAVSWDDDA